MTVFFSEGASPARTLAIVRPQRLTSRLAFRLGAVGSRLRPEVELPTPAADLLTHLSLPADEATVVIRREHANGRLVLALGIGAEVRWLVKSESRSSLALQNEAAVLARLEASSPDLAPRLASFERLDDRVALVQHAVHRIDYRRIGLSDALAVSCELADLDLTHGDLAEWNMIRSPHGIVVCDWESSLDRCVPLYDLAHFIVQSGSLLGRWSSRRAVGLLVEPGSPGEQYASRLGLDEEHQREAVIQYLEGSSRGLEQSTRGAIYRRDMLARVRARG
jgi:hypothetical protein